MNTGQVTFASRQRRSISEAATSGLGMSRGPHISIRGGRFRLVNGAGVETLVEQHHLDLVVIDANERTSKLFFEGAYDPNSDAPPTCFSDNGTGPSTQALQPQAPTCAICRWNAIGSEISNVSGKAIKACSDRKKFGVILDNDETMTVYELQIPPGSLTNMRAYARWISEQPSPVAGRKLDIADVVTRMTFDADKPNTLQFQGVGLADDDFTVNKIAYIDEQHLSDAAVGRADVAHDPQNMQAMLAERPAAPALPPPVAQPAFRVPEQANSPPVPQTRAALAAPVAPAPQTAAAQAAAPAAPAPAPRGRRGRPAAAAPSNPPGNGAAAPFMAAAQPAPAFSPPQEPAAAPNPIAPPAMPDIPQFLQRASNGVPPAGPTATAPGARAPFATVPPAPPANLQAVMGLPTRR